jgi:hypothetical protein
VTQPPNPEPDWEATTPYAGPPSYPAQPGPHQQPFPGPAYGPPPGWGAPSYGPSPGWGAPGWVAPPYGPPPGWGAPGWGAPGWGAPGWGPPQPPRPQRPGTSIAAAVLAFTLALLTLVGTVYAAAFSALLTIARRPTGGLDSWTPFAQLAVVGALVAGGVLVLGGRRTVLLAGAVVELLLAIWWFVVLGDVAPSGVSGSVGLLPLVFGVLAATAAALAFAPSAQEWARHEEGRRAQAREAAAAPTGGGNPAGG